MPTTDAAALAAYRQYGQSARDTFLEPRRERLRNLQTDRLDPLLKHVAYEQMLQSIDDAVASNAQIATAIFEAGCSELAGAADGLLVPFLAPGPGRESWRDTATAEDCSIARACVRGLLRDWSREGLPERDAAHTPILNVLRREFDHLLLHDKADARVLVPGAGLGRLVHSIGELGHSVEAVDVSYHTLLSCLYLFGGGSGGNSKSGTGRTSHTLYPWALNFSNHIRRQHQLRSVTVPDLHLSGPIKVITTAAAAACSMEQRIVFKKGGFVEVYSTPAQANTFSALVTCFFIDTAPNFLDYVNAAWNCLRPGGIWINIGPLLWNIEENGPAGNGEGDPDGQESWKARTEAAGSASAVLEFTAEEVLEVIRARGFVIEQAADKVGTSTYVGSGSGMLRYMYDMAFWVARKPKRGAHL